MLMVIILILSVLMLKELMRICFLISSYFVSK